MSSDPVMHQALALVAAFLTSAFFGGAETAVTSLGYLKAKHLLDSKKPGAKSLQLWLAQPNRILTTILVYKNAANTLAAVLGATLASRFLGSNAAAAAFGVVTLLIITFGEVIPKAFAKTHHERFSLAAMSVLKICYYIGWPVIWLFSELANRTVRLFGNQHSGHPVITEDELEFLVEVSERSGVLEKLKKKMLSGVFDFDEIKVREIMTPRTDMQALSVTASYRDVVTLVIEWGYSRIPVYEDAVDNIVGVVLAKDLLRYTLGLQKPDMFNIRQVMRKAVFVPESNFINDVFRELKATKTHIAIVIDEHGGTAGLVTLEDVIETIVGEIQDEHDEEEQEFRRISESTYQVSGAATVDDFLEYFRLDEDTLAEKPEGDIDTMGGWLTQLLQDLPKVGQSVNIGSLKIEITRIDRHRIRSVRVTDLGPQRAQEEELDAGEHSPAEALPIR